MAKTLHEANITGRAARERLQPGVYWRGIDPDVHLGYRRGKRGGRWLVRWRDRNTGGYRQATLGTADDELREGTLDYGAATRAAREAVEAARREARALAQGPALTVRFAVETYISYRDARDSGYVGRDVRSDASRRLARYVIGRDRVGNRKAVEAAPLAAIALHELTEPDLIKWREALPKTLKSSTKRRLANDLKAALNAAHETHRARLPSLLPATIKAGLRTPRAESNESGQTARDNQILTDRQVASLIAAAREIDAEISWDGDLFQLVVVLAATGARFSQVARLRVGDVQTKERRLLVPISRKGKGDKGGFTPVPVGADVLEVLLPAVTGRPTDASLLERWRSRQAPGGIRWERIGRGPWQTPAELVRPWASIRKRAGLPTAIPYALRHSSIVRGIRTNLPIRLVAALHDTSVAMIERHYGRFIADGLDDLAARAVVPLVPNESSGHVVAFPVAQS